jgi:hypothetical protein
MPLLVKVINGSFWPIHSTVAWQLTLTHPSKQKHIQQNEPSSTDTNANDRDLCILIFHSLIGSDKVVSL